MRDEAKKYLYDIQRAAELLVRFTSGKGLSDYKADPMLKAATERQFEVIGEALGQLARVDGETAARISASLPFVTS